MHLTSYTYNIGFKKILKNPSQTSCCFETLICKCPHPFPKEKNVVLNLVLEIISSLALDLQQSFFKIPMKNQTLNVMKIPLDFNPVIWLWHFILFFKALCHKLFKLFKCFKLVNIANVLVSRCVKDERYFSNLKILKLCICKKMSLYLSMVMNLF